MNYKEIGTLKEGNWVLLRDGQKAMFRDDLSKRTRYFASGKVAFLELDTVCDDKDHCVEADNSTGRINPCYGHKKVVWPAQIVKRI